MFLTSPILPGAPLVMVTGSRLFTNRKLMKYVFCEVLGHCGKVVIMHGKCDPRRPDDRGFVTVPWDEALAHPRDDYQGSDWFADELARLYGWGTRHFPADWTNGRGGGPMRNKLMIDKEPNLCLAFPCGDSRGTRGAATLAVMHHIPVMTFETTV